MAEVLGRAWGNPSSVHAEGAGARAAVERARPQVADLLGAGPDEVVVTAGATEANSPALRGCARAGERPGSLVACAAGHPSVDAPLAALEAAGWRILRVPVDVEGLLDPEALAATLRPDTALVDRKSTRLNSSHL